MSISNVFNPNTGGTVPDAAPATAAAWKELAVSDMATAAGGYSLTHGAGSNGFTQRITIDNAADSNYLMPAVTSFIYFDTGLSLASLADKKVTSLSILLEFSIAPGDALITDANGFFNFGLAITNNTTIGSATTGLFGGLTCTSTAGDTAVRPLSGIGKSGQTSSLSLSTFTSAGDNGYDYSNGDTVVSIQLSASGLNAKEASDKYGFTGGDIIYGLKKAGSVYVNDLLENVLKDDRRAGAGNLIFGLIAGQKTSGFGGTAQSKTLDFNMHYLLETMDV
tara:strand:+ start:2181 stop:3017 length:837 start_codon:yes stop_codon:yes gene_type:complete